MRGEKLQAARPRRFWRLVERQHGVVSKRQLLGFGYTAKAIEHRVRSGRLHRIWRGVYVVGRRELSESGRLMAAVLACGDDAAVSHESAAWRWQLRRRKPREIELTVPAKVVRVRPGIVVHRRASLTSEELTEHERVPITTPICATIDLAARLSDVHLEALVNEADKLEHFSPAELRTALDSTGP